MISIELTDTKDFMNKLLRTEIFDNFLLQEAVITKAASYVIDGHLQKGFYSSTELEDMEHTLSSLHSAFTVSDISGFFINIRYQSQLLTLTTGISYNIFSADKTLDSEWDKLVMKFLANNDINFKEL